MMPVRPLPALQCTTATLSGASIKNASTCSQKALMRPKLGTCAEPCHTLLPPIWTFVAPLSILHASRNTVCMQGACLVVIKGEAGHVLELLGLVRVGLLRAEVVHAVRVTVPLFEEPLHVGHPVAVQACMGAEHGHVEHSRLEGDSVESKCPCLWLLGLGHPWQ